MTSGFLTPVIERTVVPLKECRSQKMELFVDRDGYSSNGEHIKVEILNI